MYLVNVPIKMTCFFFIAFFQMFMLSLIHVSGASITGKDSVDKQQIPSTTEWYLQKSDKTPPATEYPADESTTYSPLWTTPPRYPTVSLYNQNCPDISNGDIYTQAEFLERLTHHCRYDRLTRPGGNVKGSTYGNMKNPPVDVFVLIDIRHIEAVDQFQFRMHMLLQYRYRDIRLDYRNESPSRSRIVGEDALRKKIWVPHVILENERDSSTMGSDSQDIYLSIDPDGFVTYLRRIKATLYCWMDLQKFPFDEQICELNMLSWTYNADQMMLRWETDQPVVVANQLHLTEYTLMNHWTDACTKPAYRQPKGAFSGNYSSLVFKYRIAREIGFYILDYFIPSIMLVCISWVSFWLQADASAPRITIGTSTMLSFITLASSQTRTLPKVSYIKASEIWFLGCTMFIFGSMVEFAFVNIIWRRKANVELKKVNSKYILKSAITPRPHRKEMFNNSGGLQKSHSCSSLDTTDIKCSKTPQYNSYLTVHSYSGDMSMPRITTESVDDLGTAEKCCGDNVNVPSGNGSVAQTPQQGSWTTMTPQEIAAWIDKRSRLVFPCAFVVFNAFYWGFVYWL